MTTFVRRLAALAVLPAALIGCGTGGREPVPAAPPTVPPPAAQAPEPPATAEPPTLSPGRAGLAPVFERSTAPAGSTGKTVALTFDADMTADQGPRAARGERFDNPPLIASLRRLEVPSTVFMTGRWVEEYPDQARSIGGDPLFEVANHSYSHHAFASPCYGLPEVRKEQMAFEVERAFAAFRAAGVRNVVPYFRFPGGCYDDRALRALAPARVTAVQWDVVSGDAFAESPGAVAEEVLSKVKPGSLVVMHCTRSAAPVTDEAVRRIVPALRGRGYRFVKVSELIAMSARHADTGGGSQQ
ncbi:polysaccharide deacetylase family protein [Streptomyces sp. NPDC059176]|uniref:polysaccharide deacetylase family protein n=1 Tax=unclassified Streptomyces TaxID=2593676 RepID=UPI0036BE097A